MFQTITTPEQDRKYESIPDLIFQVIKIGFSCVSNRALAQDCEHGNCACARAASNAAGKLVWG